jgi:hypothetical protein
MLDIICIIWIKIDLIASILIHYRKIFRSLETTEKMSKYSEEGINIEYLKQNWQD